MLCQAKPSGVAGCGIVVLCEIIDAAQCSHRSLPQAYENEKRLVKKVRELNNEIVTNGEWVCLPPSPTCHAGYTLR